MHIKSKTLSKIAGVKHGFGTRAEPVPACLQPEWDESHASWRQVHGIEFREVYAAHQKFEACDAFVCRKPRLPIAVVTADCVPILLAKKDGAAIAAIHAGWRGTLAGVVANTWRHFSGKGEKASDWVAAIGPAIGPCCYEVSEELVSDFIRQKKDVPEKIISPEFRRLDLPAIHARELGGLGFREVDMIRMCTRCTGGEDPGFFSHRRDQNQDRQYSGLVIV